MRLVLDARTAAFAGFIDYAGLFPPSSQTMEGAVDSYLQIRSSNASWVGGRFLCRASQLSDLAAAATAKFRQGEVPWEISVIFDLPVGESAAQAIDFRAEMDPVMTVAATEARLEQPTVDGVGALLDAMLAVDPQVVPFVEVDRSTSIGTQIKLIADALASRRRTGGAKLRCGGATSGAVPTVDEVAEFIISSTNERLPFKATAGLHQPIRRIDADLGVERHGFVNILMATALAEAGSDLETVTEVIQDRNPGNFRISAAFGTWQGHSIPGSALRRMRQNGFISYGSCDFDEPIEALELLDFLGNGG